MSKRQIIRTMRFAIICCSLTIVTMIVGVALRPSLAMAFSAVPGITSNAFAIVVATLGIKYVRQRKDLDP